MKVNGTVYNFLSPGNIEIKGLSAKTNYKALVYKLNGEFQNKIYIETIYFKTGRFLIYGGVFFIYCQEQLYNANSVFDTYNFIYKTRFFQIIFIILRNF